MRMFSKIMSKRLLFFIVSLVMMLSVACGKGNNNSNASNASNENTTVSSTTIVNQNDSTKSSENVTKSQSVKKEETTKQTQSTKKEETTKKETTKQSQTSKATTSNNLTKKIDEKGSYYSKEEVALYIHTYGKLPDNFITKEEAEKLGWSGGSLEKYAPGKAIGGSYYGNYEKTLPVKNGRKYTECDIDTNGKLSRGAKRIVFSNDGLIYYTDDHYEHFELLYGEE